VRLALSLLREPDLLLLLLHRAQVVGEVALLFVVLLADLALLLANLGDVLAYLVALLEESRQI